MFIGHFAVAFAAKRAEPRLPLPLLCAAVQFLDILWPSLVLLGVEHSRIVPGIMAASPLDLYDMPWSHSLVTSLVWSALFSLPWWLSRQVRSAWIVAGCVFSHFILDWLTHRPDLALAPGSAVRFGLGLWNWLIPAVVVEAVLFGAGIWLYVAGTRATSPAGSIGFWAFVVVLAGGWLSGVFGPPPPSIEVVTISALVATPLFLLWSWAIDRGRTSRSG
jgi:hypothetical protein